MARFLSDAYEEPVYDEQGKAAGHVLLTEEEMTNGSARRMQAINEKIASGQVITNAMAREMNNPGFNFEKYLTPRNIGIAAAGIAALVTIKVLTQ